MKFLYFFIVHIGDLILTILDFMHVFLNKVGFRNNLSEVIASQQSGFNENFKVSLLCCQNLK